MTATAPQATILKDRYVLLADLPNAEQLAARVTPSKVVPTGAGKGVVLPYNLRTVEALQRWDFYVPAPLHRDYDWPGRFTPFEHQRETVDFLVRHPRALVLSDMGTGKTASALWAADYLMAQRRIRRALIIAPLSCIHSVWEEEVFTCVPRRSIVALHAERDKRKYLARRSSADFYVINHDGFQIVTEELLERGDIDLVIYDEGSALRTPSTDRFKIFRDWVKRRNPRLWILTGTPTPNAPTDAWALGRLVNPKNTPSSYLSFRDSTMWKSSQFKWKPRNNANVLVRQILQPAIRHRKEDCIDLPPVTYTRREVALSKQQESAFKAMKKEMRAIAMQEAGQGVQVSAVNAASRLIKLMQICSGSVYADDESVVDLPMADRLAVTRELIEQSEGKVIIFVTFRHVMRRLAEWLEKSAKIPCGLIHGSVTGSARDEVLRRFKNQEHPRVLIAQPRTASHGLNLTVASTIIWFQPTFSAEQYQQANERMARPGQTRKMTIAHLGAHPVEWGAYDVVRTRQASQAAVLALYERVMKEKP